MFNLLPLFVTAAATAVYRIALPFLKLQQPAAFSFSTFFQPVVVATYSCASPLSLSLLYKLVAERKKERKKKESASIGA